MSDTPRGFELLAEYIDPEQWRAEPVVARPVVVPAGEPLAVWDAREPGWCDRHWRERTEWATAHLDALFTYRAEFYLIDAPFAVVHKFARNGDGRKWAANGEPVTEPPVIVPLAELPPAHLLEAA